jgi:hypothetical protein
MTELGRFNPLYTPYYGVYKGLKHILLVRPTLKKIEKIIEKGYNYQDMAATTHIKNMSSLMISHLTDRNKIFSNLRSLEIQISKQKEDLVEMKAAQQQEFNQVLSLYWEQVDEGDNFGDGDSDGDIEEEHAFHTRKRTTKKLCKGMDVWLLRGKKRVKEARSRKKTNRFSPKLYFVAPTQEEIYVEFMREICEEERHEINQMKMEDEKKRNGPWWLDGEIV